MKKKLTKTDLEKTGGGFMDFLICAGVVANAYVEAEKKGDKAAMEQILRKARESVRPEIRELYMEIINRTIEIIRKKKELL